jgi:hypothetical protein
MGDDNTLGVLDERVVGIHLGLASNHIQAGAEDLAGVEGRSQVLRVDDGSARSVDQHGRLLHLLQEGRVDEVDRRCDWEQSTITMSDLVATSSLSARATLTPKRWWRKLGVDRGLVVACARVGVQDRGRGSLCRKRQKTLDDTLGDAAETEEADREVRVPDRRAAHDERRPREVGPLVVLDQADAFFDAAHRHEHEHDCRVGHRVGARRACGRS